MREKDQKKQYNQLFSKVSTSLQEVNCMKCSETNCLSPLDFTRITHIITKHATCNKKSSNLVDNSIITDHDQHITGSIILAKNLLCTDVRFSSEFSEVKDKVFTCFLYLVISHFHFPADNRKSPLGETHMLNPPLIDSHGNKIYAPE